MSQSNQKQMAEASLEKIDLVGNKRRQNLRSAGCVNVGDVADADPDELYREMTGISSTTLEKVINNARALVGVDDEATINTETDAGQAFPTTNDPSDASTGDVDVPEKYQADDNDEDNDDESSAVVEELDAESFLESSPDPLPEPGECENVLLVAGDDAFDVEGEYGDLDPQEQAQLVQRRLVEYGFDPEAVGAMESGMGRQAINSWVRYTANETERELPTLVQFGVEPEGDYPTREDYEARNEEAIEWADAVCAVADGDYVGMWYNMARDANIVVRTPMMMDDE